MSENLYDLRITSGVLLLLNCPKFMDFGIDFSSWTIGDKFMGIKHIPPGPHFIYYSTKDEDYMFKQGFFIDIKTDHGKNNNENNSYSYSSFKNKIHIRKWNPEIGDFVHLKEEDEKNFSIGVQNLDFDAYLGNYPTDQIENWRSLSNFINEKILQKLEPISKRYITSSKEYENNSSITDTEIKGNIYFTNIPTKKFSLKCNFKTDPETLTKLNIDKSTILEELLLKEYNVDTNLLLGEFQYSFITFFLCEIYESFEQWKNIFILISSAYESIKTRESFYCEFIEVVYHQFRQFPKDFFYDEISSDNFLKRVLNNFIKFCESLVIDEMQGKSFNKLIKRIKLFKKFLKEFFDFEIKDEEQRIIEKYLTISGNKDILKEESLEGMRNFRENINKLNLCGGDLDDDLPVIVDEEEINSILKYREEMNMIENLQIVDVDTEMTVETENDDISIK
jgi:A1 cistron-splicing factor AAR2